ncbi:MAG TPA: ABC transporter substrate-binding protein [Acidimicrobiales bacterium]|nr:ABC transporter substrate-binding protein [Acidimicrobiales bacterium]
MRRTARNSVMALIICGALILGACSNASTTGHSSSGNTNGVFSNRILVGALNSQSGPLPADFAPIVDGVKAYFNMVNAQGGVNGRKIDLPSNLNLDDASSPSQDVDQARALVDQYNVFAVVGVATPSFSGASYLAQHNVPTFGYPIQTQWTDGPSLFGSTGSFVGFNSPQPEAAFLATQAHAKVAAVLAYNIDQSSQACQGIISSIKQFGLTVGYQDLSIPAPAGDLSSDVTHIRDSGATFIASCMDIAGNIKLAQQLQQAGINGLTQYWLNGYDQSYLDSYQSLMQGTYFLIGHVPFEAPKYFPGKYPGMEQYLAQMEKYYPGAANNEVALNGWISAAQFVTGLRSIGRDVTRSRLVNAINKETDFTANGIMPAVNWVKGGHSNVAGPLCDAFVQVQGSSFVPVYGTAGTVFTCFNYPYPNVTTPTTIALQPGIIGPG